MTNKPVLKYAVVLLFINDSGLLDSEVWVDDIDSFREASEERIIAMDNNRNIPVQNVQIVQYQVIKPA